MEDRKGYCLCGCGKQTIGLKQFYSEEHEENHCRAENARYARKFAESRIKETSDVRVCLPNNQLDKREEIYRTT